MNSHLLIVFAAISSCCSIAFCDEPDKPKKIGAVKQQIELYEQTALKWIDAFGTDQEDVLHKRMKAERNRVIEIGEPAIPHLCILLKHKQVNVRRGSGIALSLIVQQQDVRDEKLLDDILLRMIYEEDIKSRSNLYHVARGIIKNRTLKTNPLENK